MRAVTPLAKHSPGYRQVSRALLLGGFSTFWLLYWPQPLLPHFARDLQLSPAQSSVILSAATAALGLALIPASVLADRFGRRPVMVASLFIAALLTLATAWAQNPEQLLILRALAGVALAGLPATAMAYAGEEVELNAVGSVMGIYVAGTALGGMSGRLATALVAEHWPWSDAVALVGAIGLVAALLMWWFLPDSQQFQARALPWSRAGRQAFMRALRAITRDATLWALYITGFLLLGIFVGLYNYLSFRLELPPFSFTSAAIGGVFLLYLPGSLASAWSGRLTRQLGRAPALAWMWLAMLLGLCLSLLPNVIWLMSGVALFTFAFFGAHAMASSWVGQRAGQHKALAASLYLMSYYLGASILGTYSGVAWDGYGWLGVVGLLSLALLVGVALLWSIRRASMHQ
ncbi:YNFM family putative membrane transporter [Paraperlucidibaca baekdonensis]|uniref:YNFM family putative membrane transporter n=1 Tax=Paraperlucidibaca baekdonensis TaxID=748120 RepID=A0A3E0H0W5_9GAMM|nr:MFS transporter [Paraperlucidibaca baekdonensis]REH36674.1 YNFM family putative membrane transporter [Paraperlucidibaca baekdonensis]